ncbi:barstar family protein [Micromonospora zamorensis]|uniref:barstar family protein n=1 Tax=Micromonospora zamorensis TaxID=709883 RepID=UPI003D961706
MTELGTQDGAPIDLNFPVEPWVVVARMSDRTLRQLISDAGSRGVVRHLDSARMGDQAGLFQEFAEKLDFPSYFGHNWYALVDCLDDSHGVGHRKKAVTVVVDSADPLIGTDFFPLFLAILCEAAERANLSLDADGEPREFPPFPLHFVFLLSEVEPSVVIERVREREDLRIEASGDRLLITSRDDD